MKTTPKTTTTRSTKKPAMKKTTEKKSAAKSTTKPADKKGAKKAAQATEQPAMSDFAAAAAITSAAAIATSDDPAPVASDAPVDAPAEEPAAVAAATTDDTPVATTEGVGTCDRCGRTDVLLRAEGGLTLHDKPDGGACNFAIEPIVAAIATALEEQPAEPDVRDMILARARTMSPARRPALVLRELREEGPAALGRARHRPEDLGPAVPQGRRRAPAGHAQPRDAEGR